jgi:IS1 family transposase/transposase-like protein
MKCPACQSEKIVKNGHIHNGKQNFSCKECGRQFVEHPENRTVSDETKKFVDRLLREKISLAGIARVTGVSEKWLQDYVNRKYADVPREISVTEKKRGRLTIECDEIWSFVASKENKQWLWFAKDTETKEIVGFHAGSRDREGAYGLWNSMPGVYRQCAVCYTDLWSAYEKIFPWKRHRPVTKASGKTNNIEGFNSMIRQRISRLVRKTLSFSRKIENHIGAIWDFIHYYNASLV